MSLPSVRFSLSLGLAVGLCACHSGAPPTFVGSVRSADRIEVRPGIPRDETPPEHAVRLHGQAFQDRFLDLGDEDRARVASIVADATTYAAHAEGKKCGGFHADYVVQWKTDGRPYQVLLCFGCHEALSLGDGEERLNDLSDAGYAALVPIFDRASR